MPKPNSIVAYKKLFNSFFYLENNELLQHLIDLKLTN